jgi:putative phage-type endonuclease
MSTGVLLDTPLTPGSPEWLQKISASKVAAILGLSTYDSPFSLWHRMKGTVAQEPTNDLMRRGHYLEPAIAAWFQDQHPDWGVEPTGTWQHPVDVWAIASPDRRVFKDDEFDAFLELKSDDRSHLWGDPGSEDVPVDVRAQCLWQLHVTGYDVCHVAMIGPYLEFAEYVVKRDEDEIAFIRDRAVEFLRTLAVDERPPIDSHAVTYQVVRELHPEISGEDVEIDAALAREYCEAKRLAKLAKQAEQLWTSILADHLGTAKRARYLGQTIAQRQAKGDGAPYLVSGRNLPTFDEPTGETA